MRDRQTYKQQARILRALANETRLMLIDRLSKEECQVSELVRMAGVDQSTVSKHLSVLKSVGVVDDDRRGNAVVFSIIKGLLMHFVFRREEIKKADAAVLPSRGGAPARALHCGRRGPGAYSLTFGW